MNVLPQLAERPDLFLLVLIGGLLVFTTVVAILGVIASGGARRRFMREIFMNPVIQERLKDPQVNVVELIDRITERAEERGPRTGVIGILEKINQDITWDVSGVIGVIVTIVLMALISDRANHSE
jgi:hypothetical protein